MGMELSMVWRDQTHRCMCWARARYESLVVEGLARKSAT